MARRGNLRFTSTRAYRRYIDELLHRARRGEIKTSDVKNLASAARDACSLMMSENIMDAHGVSDQEAKLEGDQDGGFKYQAHRKAKNYKSEKRTSKVVVKQGPVEQTETHTLEGDELPPPKSPDIVDV